MDNAGCEQICSNSDGSFNCDCRAGFRLKSDKMGCEGEINPTTKTYLLG